jgi:hypothetical protein
MMALNDSQRDFYDRTDDMQIGEWALTTQDYVAVNIKFGRQFEASTYNADTANEDIIVQTGDKPVLVKSLGLEVDGLGVQYTWYINPEYDALGDPIPVFNVKHDSPNESTVQMDFCTTVTGVGTQISPEITLLGASEPGVSATPSSDVRGFERPLAPNSVFLLRRSAIQGTAQASDMYMTWYEGDFDYNLEA